MKTAPTNKKVREIITMVKEGKIIPRPEFQRRLIWTRDDKNYFLDSVLRGFPFPEIYLADGDVNLETGEGTQLLVDGLQRVNTLVQYFEGDSTLSLLSITDYEHLSDDDKKAFLQYDIAVRDLGQVTKDQIIEVFKRINATKYSLNDIEISNAIFNGAFKKYGEKLCEHDFFKEHSIFTFQDYKRMGDLRYLLVLIATMIRGYFNRDEFLEELLDRYNDDFPLDQEITNRFENVLSYIEECGFEPRSRIWKKSDFFSMFIELDQSLNIKGLKLEPSDTIKSISDFYSLVNDSNLDQNDVPSIYSKAAIQASNDRINRVKRGVIIGALIELHNIEEIKLMLKSLSLV